MNTTTQETTEAVPAPAPVDWGAVIGLHAAVTAVIAFVITVIWGLTGGGYFWPMWVWAGISLPLGVHYVVYKSMTAPDRNLFRLNCGLTAVAEVYIFSVWLMRPIMISRLAAIIDAPSHTSRAFQRQIRSTTWPTGIFSAHGMPAQKSSAARNAGERSR